MLVLSRHKGEAIRTGNGVTITVIEIRGDKVRLGVEVEDRTVSIHRGEVWDAIVREGGNPRINEKPVTMQPAR